jgi:single-stranded DNA-binding protein
LQTRSWNDKNDVKRYVTEIIAKSMQFLGASEGKVEGTQHAAASTGTAATTGAHAAAGDHSGPADLNLADDGYISDEDIPF